MRRVQSTTVVNANGLDTAAVRGGSKERDNLLWSVESMVIPGEGKLVTPARALQEKLLDVFVVLARESLIQRCSPFRCNLVDIGFGWIICCRVCCRLQLI